MPWAQRNQRLGFHRMPRHKTKAKSLRDRCDHQRRFQQRETLPDASPRPVAKRVINSRRQTVRKPIEPALRAERIGIVKISRIAMQHPL